MSKQSTSYPHWIRRWVPRAIVIAVLTAIWVAWQGFGFRTILVATAGNIGLFVASKALDTYADKPLTNLEAVLVVLAFVACVSLWVFVIPDGYGDVFAATLFLVLALVMRTTQWYRARRGLPGETGSVPE